MIVVGDGDSDLDCDLGHVLSTLSTCWTPCLFPHSADQGASFMPSVSKHLQRLCVLGLVAGSVFGEMTKTWPLTSRSSGIEEVKVKIFKGIQTHWGVCLTQMQWLFVCLFLCVTVLTYFCFFYDVKRRLPTSLLFENVFFSWSKRIMREFQSFSLQISLEIS